MRYELADHEWIAIKPMLPNKPRGVPAVNDRRVLNGIFWILRSGAPWRDLPDIFGPYRAAILGAHSGGEQQARHVAPRHPALLGGVEPVEMFVDETRQLPAAAAGKRRARSQPQRYWSTLDRPRCTRILSDERPRLENACARWRGGAGAASRAAKVPIK